jgi:hypothetical protein
MDHRVYMPLKDKQRQAYIAFVEAQKNASVTKLLAASALDNYDSLKDPTTPQPAVRVRRSINGDATESQAYHRALVLSADEAVDEPRHPETNRELQAFMEAAKNEQQTLSPPQWRVLHDHEEMAKYKRRLAIQKTKAAHKADTTAEKQLRMLHENESFVNMFD